MDTLPTISGRRKGARIVACLGALLTLLSGCARHRAYQNRDMDFGSIKAVAILPFANLSRDPLAADRVRDVFSNMLLATQAVYVLPPGEVARAVSRLGLGAATAPTADEVVKLGALLKVDAVMTGVLREYGEVRSSTSTANVVSMSVQMHETTTGKVIWAGSSTKGGIGWGARLLGTAGGDPVNDVTEQSVDELLAQLFR